MAQEHNPHTDPITDQEEEAWNSLEYAQAIQKRNRDHFDAWSTAAQYMAQNAHQLGSMTLREAFEQGFIAGRKPT
jgi:hypothetical protein